MLSEWISDDASRSNSEWHAMNSDTRNFPLKAKRPELEPRHRFHTRSIAAEAERTRRGVSCVSPSDWSLALASALINVLYLTGSLYMLEVYDRVLPSRSVPTLVGLSILVVVLYGFQAVLDLLRGRVLVRIGRSLGQKPELAGL